MTQFIFILEPRLISKTLCFTNQVVIYYSNFITKISKIFHTLQEWAIKACVYTVTWATLKKAFTFTDLKGQREATLLQTARL